jgi:hypothetical protein
MLIFVTMYRKSAVECVVKHQHTAVHSQAGILISSDQAAAVRNKIRKAINLPNQVVIII